MTLKYLDRKYQNKNDKNQIEYFKNNIFSFVYKFRVFIYLFISSSRSIYMLAKLSKLSL
jgi:hypothetical protein